MENEQLYRCPKWETCKDCYGDVDHSKPHELVRACGDVWGENTCPACEPISQPIKPLELPPFDVKDCPPENEQLCHLESGVSSCSECWRKSLQAEANRQLQVIRDADLKVMAALDAENKRLTEVIDSRPAITNTQYLADCDQFNFERGEEKKALETEIATLKAALSKQREEILEKLLKASETKYLEDEDFRAILAEREGK